MYTKPTVLTIFAAISLSAATTPQLTVGTTWLGAGQTGTVNVTLAIAGASISGVQFDLAYDPTAMTVTVSTGAGTTAVNKGIQTNALDSQTVRAIAIGGLTQASLDAGGGQSTFTDGAVVATVNVQILANASVGLYALTLSKVVGTTPGATGVTIGTTSGSISVAQTYTVGDVNSPTGDSIGQFGDKSFNVLDLLQVLVSQTVDSQRPATCTDRFDAMDVYPAMNPSGRGGDGVLNILDVLHELAIETGQESHPSRAARGGCPAGQSAQPAIRPSGVTSQARRGQTAVGGVVLGPAERMAGGQERVPVYLETRSRLNRVAMSFAVGDGQSKLSFVAGEAAPTAVQANQQGYVALAWLEGLSVPAGGRVLLGYVSGPAGMAGNLSVSGMSAAEMDSSREINLDGPSRSGREQ